MTYQASIVLNQKVITAANQLVARAKQHQQKSAKRWYSQIMMYAGVGLFVFINIALQHELPESRPVYHTLSLIIFGMVLGAFAIVVLYLKMVKQPEWQLQVQYQITEDEFRLILEDRQTLMPWSSLKKVLMGQKYWLILSNKPIPNELGFLFEVDTLSPELQAFLRAKLPCEVVS